MQAITETYTPSWRNVGKYRKYISYFLNYLLVADFKSLWASLKYVLFLKLPKFDYIAKSKMGKFLIRKDTVDFQFINPAYEGKIKKYIKDHINDFDIFIDCGACMGEYCIWLAKMGKRCVAIEPISFETIWRNAALNRVSRNIQTYGCGVGAKKEKVFFNITQHLGCCHIDKDSSKEPNVMIDTLDNLSESFEIFPTDRVLLKLDVEGMEPEVIAGGLNFLRSRKDLIVIYEHFEGDSYRNDRALFEVGQFDFSDLDEANRIAIKNQRYIK